MYREMASVKKRAYITKNGDILYGDDTDEYLLDEDKHVDNSEIYIKEGNILRGKEAAQEKVACDVRDAMKKSGISKWLGKLESESKQKKDEDGKHVGKEEKKGSAATEMNLAEKAWKVGQEVVGSEEKKSCHNDKDELGTFTSGINKNLPSKLKKSVVGKGLQMAKDGLQTGQDAVKMAKETGQIIKDATTIPEFSVSGNADFAVNLEGHIAALRKTSNGVRVGEAQLQTQGKLHSGAQINSKRYSRSLEVDAGWSANADLAALDIQVGDSKQGTEKKSTGEKPATQPKSGEFTAKLRGSASASARGAHVKINASRPPPQPVNKSASDVEVNLTAAAQVTGINVDIKTKDESSSSTSDNSTTNSSKKPKVRVQAKASAAATGLDVKIASKLKTGTKSDTITPEAHVHAEATGGEVQIGNKIEKPKFKGASASAKVKATGAAARIGNVYKSERDDGVAATAEARLTGAELNVGNVIINKGSSSGVAAVADVKKGLTAFNFHAGMGGQAGIKVSTDVQFGNIGFNWGPPSLNISPFAFNLGFGGGIQGSVGTAAKGGDKSSGGSKGEGCEGDPHDNDRHGSGTQCNGSDSASGYTSGSNGTTEGNNGTVGTNRSGDSSTECCSGDGQYGNNYDVENLGLHYSNGSNYSTSGSYNGGHAADCSGTEHAGTNIDTQNVRLGQPETTDNLELPSGDFDSSNVHTSSFTNQNGYEDNPNVADCSSHSASNTQNYAVENLGLHCSNGSSGSYNGGYAADYNGTEHAGSNIDTQNVHLGPGYQPEITDNLELPSVDYHSSNVHTSSFTNQNGYEDNPNVTDCSKASHSASKYTQSHQYSDGYNKASHSTNGNGYNKISRGTRTHRRTGQFANASVSKSNATNAGHHTGGGQPISLSNSSHKTASPVLAAVSRRKYYQHLPRKLDEHAEPQNSTPSHMHNASYGHQTLSNSGNSPLGGVTQGSTDNGKPKKENETFFDMIDDELSQKLSLLLGKNKTSKKSKNTKSLVPWPAGREDSKQQLTEALIKAREKLEMDEASNPAAGDNHDLPSKDAQLGTTEKSQKGTLSSSTSAGGQSEDDNQVEEVPIPEEKKKPFGANKNIFTMDSIRTSSYKVQKSNKSLQKIGYNVMGFQ